MKALEFYSGIGGMHYALLDACPGSTVLAAFDLNTLANDVYQHNLGQKPICTNISTCTPRQLDGWAAEIWLMSPPCQPYTRRGLKKQSEDGRAQSFLALLDMLPKLQHPPRYILLENVVGFESSDTRQQMVDVLSSTSYTLQEFILSPTQLNVPYSRPRYFALAKLKASCTSNPKTKDENREGKTIEGRISMGGFMLPQPEDGQPYKVPPSILLNQKPFKKQGMKPEETNQNQNEEEDSSVPSLKEFLGLGQVDATQPAAAAEEEDQKYQGADLELSNDLLLRHGWCLDIVTGANWDSNCFTKTYGYYIKGSGSVLATRNEDLLPEILTTYRTPTVTAAAAAAANGVDNNKNNNSAKDGTNNEAALEQVDGGVPEDTEESKAQKQEEKSQKSHALCAELKRLGLRFFSPKEIALLHSFPPEFDFPPTISLKQRYAMLGNSLSVKVVSDLLKYLFMEEL